MRIYADDLLWQQIVNDRSLEQAVNVATLPGVTGCVYAMPDVHEGYGFPVGGVAAMEADDGVIHEWRAGGAGERLVEQAGAAPLVCGVRS